MIRSSLLAEHCNFRHFLTNWPGFSDTSLTDVLPPRPDVHQQAVTAGALVTAPAVAPGLEGGRARSAEKDFPLGSDGGVELPYRPERFMVLFRVASRAP
jgi:hypothetical protein